MNKLYISITSICAVKILGSIFISICNKNWGFVWFGIKYFIENVFPIFMCLVQPKKILCSKWKHTWLTDKTFFNFFQNFKPFKFELLLLTPTIGQFNLNYHSLKVIRIRVLGLYVVIKITTCYYKLRGIIKIQFLLPNFYLF